MKKDLFSAIRSRGDGATKKPSTFAEDLFKHLDNSLWSFNRPKQESSQLTEKSIVLDSAKQFIEEKVASQAPEPVKIMGAEASLKASSGKLVSEQNYQVLPFSDLKNLAGQNINKELVDHRYQDKLNTPIDYLFVSDNFYDNSSVEGEALAYLANVTPYYFQKEAAILFAKMAKALGSPENKIAMASLKSEGNADLKELFCHELVFYQPKVVITLGARVTNSLLSERKRIAEVHGQFFDISILQDNAKRSYSVMPLFHPEFLWANPNMKAAAWADLQNAMKFIRSK